VFKDSPPAPTKEDVFEQIVNFTFSEKYPAIKALVELSVGKRGLLGAFMKNIR
jgi:hypothetical protein